VELSRRDDKEQWQTTSQQTEIVHKRVHVMTMALSQLIRMQVHQHSYRRCSTSSIRDRNCWHIIQSRKWIPPTILHNTAVTTFWFSTKKVYPCIRWWWQRARVSGCPRPDGPAVRENTEGVRSVRGSPVSARQRCPLLLVLWVHLGWEKGETCDDVIRNMFWRDNPPAASSLQKDGDSALEGSPLKMYCYLQ
jgi:hypothetical protein